jgi:hypothetical protein
MERKLEGHELPNALRQAVCQPRQGNCRRPRVWIAYHPFRQRTFVEGMSVTQVVGPQCVETRTSRSTRRRELDRSDQNRFPVVDSDLSL